MREIAEWWAKYTVTMSDVIAFGAAFMAFVSALVSGWSAKKTVAFGRTQDRLNKMQIDEREKAELGKKRAQLFASVKKKPPDYYYFQVENLGPANAWDVNIEILPDDPVDLFTAADYAKLTPFELLAPDRGFTFHVSVNLDTKRKQQIRLTWKDAAGAQSDIFVLSPLGDEALLGERVR